MRRKLVLLPLAVPLALFIGCEGTAQNDTTTTDSALESCFSASGSGSTKCAIQSGGFSRDPQDVDHDGRQDSFVCAHIVKVPHGWMGGAGGSSGASTTGDSGGARPAPPAVPTDADCDHMGCQDQRPHHGGAAGQSGSSAGPAAGSAAPASTDTAPAGQAAGAPADDDMTCPGHGPQGQGAGGAGDPSGHRPGDDGAGGANGEPNRGPGGAGGAGAPSGHGPGDQGGGDNHGAGGAGAP